jgi:hypothetical protein
MEKRRFVLAVVVLSLLGNAVSGCRQNTPAKPTPNSTPTVGTAPTVTPVPATPTVLAVATATLPPDTPTVPATPSGPAIAAVQFALDVDDAGELVFPADSFVFGVTRVYVRFEYHAFADVARVMSNWYLNENLVSSGTLDWDGGATGAYILWLEDLQGLGRGEWRWELLGDGRVLGTAAFAVGGGPLFTKAEWQFGFDPPTNWREESDAAAFVTFSSPDERQALAVHVVPLGEGMAEAAEASLALFRREHADAQVVMAEETTMNGEEALLQQIRYDAGEAGPHTLFIVTAAHADFAYSLWVLGPSEQESELNMLLTTTLRSVRFLGDG